MRYVIIFLILLSVYVIGWIFGASSKWAKEFELTAGTLHIDKEYDYMWQFEFNSESTMEEIKKRSYVAFKVDNNASLHS